MIRGYEIDRVKRGDVRLYAVWATESCGERREWCQTYATVAEAKRAKRDLEERIGQ